MNKKHIFIVADFLIDFSLTSRFIYLAKLLIEAGFDVTIVTSDYDHASKSFIVERINKLIDDHVPVVYLHEPSYPRNISIKRLYSHWVWGKNVRNYFNSLKQLPDCIYCPIPPITQAKLLGNYCNKNRIKYVVDIQDLWPEAFQLAVPFKLARWAFSPMTFYVNKAYSTADLVIGVSDTYRVRGLRVNKKDTKGLTVYLGNCFSRFEKARDTYRECKPRDEIWIAYVGTMGFSYDVDSAIDAIALAQKSLKTNLKLVALGDGPLLQRFKEHAKQAGIDSIFTGALPYEKMVGKMCSCDIVINPIHKGAAQSVTNKVGDYAMSGLPVVNTQENREYRQLVEKYKCGINCECENVDDIANAIIKLSSDLDLRIKMGINSLTLGKEKFDRENTYNEIVNAIKSML